MRRSSPQVEILDDTDSRSNNPKAINSSVVAPERSPIRQSEPFENSDEDTDSLLIEVDDQGSKDDSIVASSDDDIIDVSAKSNQQLPAIISGPVSTVDALTAYLNEIRKYPLLTPEEEHELAIKYAEKGDQAAAQRLVTSNLRFVVKIAAEYSRFGAKMIDLVQEGNVGLMHAVKEFNPYKGVRLITYAVWWIRGYIREYLLKQHSMVRIGTTHNQKKLFYNLHQEEKKMEALGMEPTTALLSSRLGVPERDVEMMQQRLGGKDISLDQPVDEDSGTLLKDLQTSSMEESVDVQLEKYEQIEILNQMIEKLRPTLNEKEILILDRRILSDEPQTLQEIGDAVGITRERARQLEARILKRLKESMEG
ncbi:MAG: RNA polymerase subunit sigma [Bdellovibrionales bacterium CG10_big_fil_rev_8_21_14_0_10_45_34]|nr:MAG: RNA polymerase subunit sigma [Bdellovibrionales bacterium CG10_big_fil_rev_8_21_14_0_10_45_34]